jgi:hypothetical protein
MPCLVIDHLGIGNPQVLLCPVFLTALLKNLPRSGSCRLLRHRCAIAGEIFFNLDRKHAGKNGVTGIMGCCWQDAVKTVFLHHTETFQEDRLDGTPLVETQVVDQDKKLGTPFSRLGNTLSRIRVCDITGLAVAFSLSQEA